MSLRTTKPAKWPVRPGKTQISLGICPLCSVRWKDSQALKPSSGWQQILWSDWADAQADLIFAGHTGHFVGFAMLQIS